MVTIDIGLQGTQHISNCGNNLFRYATKELSQDAFLCWCINWLNYNRKSPLYKMGKAVLNLFAGKEGSEAEGTEYAKVVVKRQYKKIDVLVLINSDIALIIEDKTNSSEHDNQLERYKKAIHDEYPSRSVIITYIKTGIMYDEDKRLQGKANVVVGLDELLKTLLPFAYQGTSDILDDYVSYLSEIKGQRVRIDRAIENSDFLSVVDGVNENGKIRLLDTPYGQYSFLNHLFPNRNIDVTNKIGLKYNDNRENNSPVFADCIYAGTNNSGSPWTQYCFWGAPYAKQLTGKPEYEYHFLFWRVDKYYKGAKNPDGDFYISLRHYDENAHQKESPQVENEMNKRKRDIYKVLKDEYKKLQQAHKDEIMELGTRENYKESDVLFIPVENLKGSLDKIRNSLWQYTQIMKKAADKFAEGESV